MRDRFKPGAPAMATETGYNNIVRPGGAGVSEAAAATYIPRLLLNNFASGVKRTFLYELLDEGVSPEEGEHHWGLIRYDRTPKPAYHALSAMLSALSDEQGTVFPPAKTVAAALRGAPPEARMLQFRKADGSTAAAIWRAVPCWDPTAARDIPVEVRPLTMELDGPVSRAAFTIPGEGTAWTELPVSRNTIAVPAGAKVVVVRLT